MNYSLTQEDTIIILYDFLWLNKFKLNFGKLLKIFSNISFYDTIFKKILKTYYY